MAKLNWILFATKIHRAIQLITIVLSLSYFVGLLWYLKVEIAVHKEFSEAEDNFVTNFNLNTKSFSHLAITLTYFMFTSLSTVGLGDFHPRSDLERVVGAFILLFGVMITSYIMENFSEMLIQIQNFNHTFEDSVQLSLFLGTLRRFNGN
mmetsp:Transcript_33579/g.51651  ORF Transcript_33579/g.51651 Transcript_33579/m.51651 type:complete len:150 (+) Transcript_33579:1350-1799(+)